VTILGSNAGYECGDYFGIPEKAGFLTVGGGFGVQAVEPATQQGDTV